MTTSEYPTMTDRIASLGITMTTEWTERNPSMDDDQWARTADHWKCTLRRTVDGKRRQLTVIFSMGSGHNGREPRADEVIDNLASEAAGIENARNFEDWASEYGYDTDSRKAERTYKACQREADKLRRFLDDDYEAVLFETERL